MNYLIDTHVFIYSLFNSTLLSKKAKGVILDKENTIFVSIITFWEISLKFNLGKLALEKVLPDDLPDYAVKSGFEILDLNANIVSTFYKLPIIKHKDPFDRLIIWQCIQNNIKLITKDTQIDEYEDFGLKVVW